MINAIHNLKVIHAQRSIQTTPPSRQHRISHHSMSQTRTSIYHHSVRGELTYLSNTHISTYPRRLDVFENRIIVYGPQAPRHLWPTITFVYLTFWASPYFFIQRFWPVGGPSDPFFRWGHSVPCGSQSVYSSHCYTFLQLNVRLSTRKLYRVLW